MKRVLYHSMVFMVSMGVSSLCMHYAGDRVMTLLIPYASPVLYTVFRLVGGILLYILYQVLVFWRKGRAVPAAFLFALCSLYIGIMLTMLFGRSHDVYQANYIPFHTIRMYMDSGWSDLYVWTNLFGNILPFLPLGAILMPLFQRKRWTLVAILVCMLSIECFQQALLRGSFDVDDILLNTGGALLGAWLYGRLRCTRSGQQRQTG